MLSGIFITVMQVLFAFVHSVIIHFCWHVYLRAFFNFYTLCSHSVETFLLFLNLQLEVLVLITVNVSWFFILWLRGHSFSCP